MSWILLTGLRLFLGALLALAVVRKIARPLHFEDAVRAYALLPEALVRPAVYAVVLAEGLALALLATSAWPLGMRVSAILLAGYAVAMGINLLRGRDHDCGCGELTERQSLHPAYPLRNLALAALAVEAARVGPALTPVDRGALHWAALVLVALLLLVGWQIGGQLAEDRD